MAAAELLSPTAYTFTSHAIPPFLVALAMLHIGMVTLRREGANAISLAFLLLTGSIGLWLCGNGMGFLSTTETVAAFWTRVAFTGICLVPVTLYLFTLVFLHRHRENLYSMWLLVLLCGISWYCFLFAPGVIITVKRYPWGYYAILAPKALLFVLLFLIVVVTTIGHFIVEYRRSPMGSFRRKRALWFMIAFATLFLVTIDFLPSFNLPVYPIGFSNALVFIIIATRTIRLYKLQDITPSYAAETIISTMQDGLLLLDYQGIIKIANRAAAAILGLPPADIVNQPLTSLLHLTPPVLPTDPPPRHQEITFTTPDGTTKNLELSRSTQVGADPLSMTTVCIIRDITETKQAEQELQEFHNLLEDRITERTKALKDAQQQLLHSEKLRAVGMLSASIAHEVGGPVFAVRNILQSLLASPNLSAAGEDAQLLRLGIEECERVGKLLDNLRELQAPSREKRLECDLHQVLDDVLQLCRKQYDRKQIAIQQQRSSQRLLVSAIPDQLKQLLLNLLNNCSEAMPGGGTITITTSATDRDIRLLVSDTGRGIAAEDLPRIFDPFFSRKQKQFGTGLGLYICHHIMERHGGTINVESSPGRGTTFSLCFPPIKTGTAARQRPAQEE